ncbi:hypothetical protein QR680_016108 [Steinernema hermaphroditum]|uniref:Uncharacterized protein n=1 Tax=Steinernema hermaphroditum TaxID=289476 RepID=A0AA39HA32_9BILA|nr:hypothetical protein QR680_016108 [Steinernema hermaphroditum]
MYAALAFVLFVISSAHAQDAYSIANYAYNNVSNFLQVNEFVAVENALVNQVCSGASIQTIFNNFANTVVQNIGGMTATKAIDACAASGANVYSAAYNDVVQYCPSGTSAVMAAASKYATDQQVQIFFDAVYQAVNGVNPNDWSIIRNDAAGAADFAKFGY